eukprot:70990-Chlamydomonas_euryale.AAC.7
MQASAGTQANVICGSSREGLRSRAFSALKHTAVVERHQDFPGLIQLNTIWVDPAVSCLG